MAGFDGKAFGREVMEIIKDYVAKVTAPLEARIRELEEGGIRYCGIHQRALAYKRGDVVTFKGSSWTSLKADNRDVPGTGDGWQLSQKEAHP